MNYAYSWNITSHESEKECRNEWFFFHFIYYSCKSKIVAYPPNIKRYLQFRGFHVIIISDVTILVRTMGAPITYDNPFIDSHVSLFHLPLQGLIIDQSKYRYKIDRLIPLPDCPFYKYSLISCNLWSYTNRDYQIHESSIHFLFPVMPCSLRI